MGTGDNLAISGMIIGNPENINNPDRRVLMKGSGPSLADSGIAGVLPDPRLELFNSGGAAIASNDQWQTIAFPLQEELIEAELAPTRAQESVMWPTLQTSNYTAHLTGINSTGIGLLELFEY